MQQYRNNTVDTNGVPVGSVVVTVRDAATPVGSGALATLYSDDSWTALANPLTSDSLGNFYFFATDGRYDIIGTKDGETLFTIGDVEIADVTDLGIKNALDYLGTDIGTKVNAAIADLPAAGGEVYIPAGAYSYATGIVINKPIWLVAVGGIGSHLTYTGSGDGIQVNGVIDIPYRNGGIKGIYLEGTSAAANGIHQTDTIGFSYEDVSIRNFTGATASGILFENNALFNERLNITGLSLYNNTNGMRFLRSGGTESFLYNIMRNVHIQTTAGQTGLFLDGSGGFVELWNGEYQIFTNQDNTLGGSTFMKVTSGSYFSRNIVNIQGEQSFGSGGIRVNIDATSNVANNGIFSIASTTDTIATGGVFSLGAPVNELSGINAALGDYGVLNVGTAIQRLGGTVFNMGFYLIPQQGAAGGYRSGIGLNAYFDGTNWRTNADGAQNSGRLWLNDGFYYIPTTGGTPGQTIADASLVTYRVAKITADTFSVGVKGNTIGTHLTVPFSAGSSYRQGLGINAYFDGANWITGTEGAGNGAQLLLNDGFYYIPSTGGTVQTITDTNLANYKHGRFGIPVEFAHLDLSNQAASIGTTTLYTTPAAAGIYRLSYYLITTTGGNAETVLATFGWNDGQAAQTVATGTIAVNTDNDFEQGQVIMSLAASQNITYATTVSGALGTGEYALFVRLECL